jgi:hypothetical protein
MLGLSSCSVGTCTVLGHHLWGFGVLEVHKPSTVGMVVGGGSTEARGVGSVFSWVADVISGDGVAISVCLAACLLNSEGGACPPSR